MTLLFLFAGIIGVVFGFFRKPLYKSIDVLGSRKSVTLLIMLIAVIIVTLFTENSWVRLLTSSILCVLMFMLGLRRAGTGFGLVLAGGLLNMTTIAINGGKMPVYTEFIAGSSKYARLLNGGYPRHATMDPSTKLKYISDIIPLPDINFSGISMVSIGDIVIAGGVLILCFCLTSFLKTWKFRKIKIVKGETA